VYPAFILLSLAVASSELSGIDAELRIEANRVAAPNLLVGVVEKAKLISVRNFGPQPVDAHTVYRIGSITKVFSALALLQLRDAGKLSFDDPVRKWIPELTPVYPTKDSSPIIIRHLVTHSSGLPPVGSLEYRSFTHDVTEQELLAAAKNVPLDFAPGSSTGYSNLGMALSGLIIARASGQPFRVYMKEHLFGPLGMTSTGWEPPAKNLAIGHRKKDGKYLPAPGSWRLGAAEAAGGIYTTLDDLAKFAAFELAAWPPNDSADDGPVKRSSVRESQLVAGFSRATEDAYGVGWSVSEEPQIGHVAKFGGSTLDYVAYIALAPRRGLGVISLLGTEDADFITRITLKTLLRLCAAAQPEPLGAPILTALTRVRALIESPDVTSIKSTFTQGFLRGLPPPSLVVAFTNFRREHGLCKTHQIRQVSSPVAATVRLRCERDEVDLKLHTSAAVPYLVHELHFDPVKP
jgi:CubicO group peptidase (beta-lactamase class C family)